MSLSIIGLISDIWNFTSFCLKSIYHNIIHYKLISVVGWTKNDYAFTVPIRIKRVGERQQKVISISEMYQGIKFSNFAKKLGKNTIFFDNSEVYTNNDDAIEFLFGGPLTNRKTAIYLLNYFPNVKLHLDINTYNKRKNEYWADYLNEYKDLFVIDKNTLKAFQYAENKYLRYEQGRTDYLIIIKVIQPKNKLMGMNKKKIIHILFGLGRVGTAIAMDIFSSKYKMFYHNHKKNNYCYAFKINIQDRSLDINTKPIDLTNDLFVCNNHIG